MNRLEQLLSRSNMRNKVLDSLDASSLSAMRATDSASVSDALRYPIHYDWREEKDAEMEYRLLPQFDDDEPPPLQLTRADAVRYTLFHIILDNDTSEVTRIIPIYELNDEIRHPNFAIKVNNEPISTKDIYDEGVENFMPSFRIVKDGETINMQSYRGSRIGRLGTLVYENGPLAGQRVLFDEKGRVISHPIRNSVYTEGRKSRKSRKSNRPKSKKSCKKRHMKWNSNTKRCNKSK